MLLEIAMKKQRKKQNNRTGRQDMQDLLLPILLVLGAVPFVIRLRIYDCGLSGYDWYSQDGTTYDFYCVARSYFFVILSAVMLLVLAFRLPLYKEKTKDCKLFIPLAVYSLFVLLSTAFSADGKLSLQGMPFSGETVFVLLGYIVVCFYTYQLLEKKRDFTLLHTVFLVVLVLMAVLGWCQMFGIDLLNFEWVQKLVMNKEEQELFLGKLGDVFSAHYVYLTLFNPNYAGQFLAMAECYIMTFCLLEKKGRKKALYGILFLALLLPLWFTYARGALVSLIAGLLVLILYVGSRAEKKQRLLLAGGIGGLVAVVLLADVLTGFHFLGRVIDQKESFPLSGITTGEQVTITYDGKERIIDDLAEGESRTVTLDGTDWTFVRQGGVYYYQNAYDRLVSLRKIPAADLKGLEYLGSARGYIWSRILPKLPRHIFVGSGPDTFIITFPQDDYVGKANYGHNPMRLIEKAHNGYLMIWLQTGLVSLLSLLVFVFFFYRHMAAGIKAAGQMTTGGKQEKELPLKLQLAATALVTAYLVGLLFNDSTLFTTPLVCIMAGMALAASHMCQK